jgi:hypothetical protein
MRLSHPPFIVSDMENQLPLIEGSRSWKLDRRTREIGRRGVAQARAALRAAHAPVVDADAAAPARRHAA